MTSPSVPATHGTLERWIGAALCAGLAVAWVAASAAPDPPPASLDSAPALLPLVAAAIGVAGVLPLHGSRVVDRVQRPIVWVGLLLLIWAANGLPFDVLTAAGLMGRRTESGEIVIATVWWPGLVTRALSMAAAIVLAHIALSGPAARSAPGGTAWYAYAAFVLALPYPALRLHWAFGGTTGLARPGAAGEGFEPLLIAIPWIAAAVLSLHLAKPRRWPSRRVILAAGWIAAAIVAMIGPAALWSVVRALVEGAAIGADGIAAWVFGLFYGSWFLWAIAAAAATRSYQLRTAAPLSGAALA